ncbi:MAG: hypothetical protein ABSC48_07315 [Terracidiphilus sp.]
MSSSPAARSSSISFERFLENQIREAFSFEGTPISFKVKARNEKKGG